MKRIGALLLVFSAMLLVLSHTDRAGEGVARALGAPGDHRSYAPLVANGDEAPHPPADLTVSHVSNSMRGYYGGCIPKYEALVVRVCVRNLGAGAAGTYAVSVNGVLGARASGLSAGTTACIDTIPSAYGFEPVTVVADYLGEVAETDEGNNRWTGQIALPTPPLICTVTPTP
jgi:hypothetical protein